MLYFDNAATSSPKPQAVLDEVARALSEYNANPGRAGHQLAYRAARRVFEARQAVAALLGARDSARVCFQFNCTDALNLGIRGALRRGDHVISSVLEHNSVLRPLFSLQSRGQITLTLVSPRDNGQIDPDDVLRALNARTRLIVLTHASNVTGAIQPVAAVGQIARARGLNYLIDGAQALGALPVDVARLGCAMYAFPGHKSLLGPQGTGGLYVEEGLRLSPPREGGTGTESDSMRQPEAAPERYEAGTLNLPGIAGLLRGVEYVAQNQSRILMHERELTTALFEGLSALPEAQLYCPHEEAARAGIVSFNLGDLSSSEVADALDRRGIAVRGGLHCAPGAHRHLGTLKRGTVRASVGHANTFEEVEALLRAARDILREGG